MRTLTAALLLLLTLPLAAQEKSEEAPAPAKPGMPQSVEDLPNAPKFEPQVTIIKKKSETVEEYRAGGELYMVKITPRNGPPYYLIDNNGDGILETRTDGLEDPIVPQWVIFRW